MMEYLELVDFIEEKVERLRNAKGKGEGALREEIKSIMLSEEVVRGPFQNENGENVYELLYFKDNAGEPELCHSEWYETKLNSLLKRNRKGELVYKSNKGNRKFIGFLYLCIKRAKTIDALAIRWSKLQKIYMENQNDRKLKNEIDALACQICAEVIKQENLSIYNEKGEIREIIREVDLEALNAALGKALSVKNSKCYDFEKNDSFNAYIQKKCREEKSNIYKRINKEKGKNIKKVKSKETDEKVKPKETDKDEDDIEVFEPIDILNPDNNEDENYDGDGNGTKVVHIDVESMPGVQISVEDEIIDKESAYRIFEALFKILQVHVFRDITDAEEIRRAENILDKKQSIYQSILSYNIIKDIEKAKLVKRGNIDIYLKNKQRIYNIIRKTLVVFLKEGNLEDFYDLYQIIIANIREGINLEKMQYNLSEYFYQSGITKGKKITRQTVSKRIEEFNELIKELCI